MEEKDLNYFSYGSLKVGKGNFDLAPVLIGTIFYQNETIVDRRNSEVFNEQKAKKKNRDPSITFE